MRGAEEVWKVSLLKISNCSYFSFNFLRVEDLVHPAYSSCEILNARAGQLELRLTKP